MVCRYKGVQNIENQRSVSLQSTTVTRATKNFHYNRLQLLVQRKINNANNPFIQEHNQDFSRGFFISNYETAKVAVNLKVVALRCCVDHITYSKKQIKNVSIWLKRRLYGSTVHLHENTFDRKRISAYPSPNPNSKAQ